MRNERKLDPAPSPDQSCFEIGGRYELKFLGQDGREMITNTDVTYIYVGSEGSKHNFSVVFRCGGSPSPLTLEENLFAMGKTGKAGVVAIPETNSKKSS